MYLRQNSNRWRRGEEGRRGGEAERGGEAGEGRRGEEGVAFRIHARVCLCLFKAISISDKKCLERYRCKETLLNIKATLG